MFVVLLVRWALLAAAFAITSWILTGMDITGGFWAYVWVSALFGVINAIIGTILRIVTFPLTVLTLGLTSHLTIDEFWWTAIWAAVIMAIVSVVLDLALSVVWRPRPAPA